MRILIISRSPWNTSNSFGNTFENLFFGMGSIEVFNICCQGGQINSKVVSKTFQMTDKLILNSIINNNNPVGSIVNKGIQNFNTKSDFTGSRYNKIVSRRSHFALIARDLIWLMGKWKKSAELKSFIKEAAPDIIYLPIYNSWYMCNLQRYILSYCNAPVVGHITDDVYSYPSIKFSSPLELIYVAVVRKVLRKLIKSCSYIDVFAKNMKEEYEKIFGVPCYLIGKGVKNSSINLPDVTNFSDSKEIQLVYTGNLGSDRWKVLCKLGKILKKLEINAKLYIYSGTILTEEMKQEFKKINNICFMGKVESQFLEDIYLQSDLLVFVESFSARSIWQAKMSFSTKIIDYLCTGKPVLAIGPSEINSIDILKKNKIAVVVDDMDLLQTKIEEIFTRKLNIHTICKNANEYLVKYRQINKIQKEMFKRMNSLLDKASLER